MAVGFVAAGGSSRRMGRDKALLPWEGTTLLDHCVTRLRTVCGEVCILSGAERRYEDHGLRVLTDATPGLGPVGGLLAALRSLSGEDAVLLALDLPFAETALLDSLLARGAGFDAVVPVTADGPQPLCAVYRPSCREAVERAVSRGDLRMTAFWPEARVRAVSEAELSRFGDPAALFRNLNTPEEYAAARR